MNYNEIVNRFKDIVEDHKMLVDFGYGQISDIKTRSEGDGEAEGADYPYLFLNPGVHNREESVVTYNFNMIIMDMAREEEASEYQNFLNIQSNCIQYCDDVIARLYYYYKDKPEISFTVSYTPFYERFQDQLAGATATISIEVPSNINECIAPFEPDYLLVLDVQSSLDQTFRPDVGDSPQVYPITNVDIYNGMSSSGNIYNMLVPSTGNWVFIERGQARKTSGTEPFVEPRILTVRANNVDVITQPVSSTFPTNSPIGEVFDYEVRWELEINPYQVDYVAVQDRDNTAVEPQYETLAGLRLTGSYQA